MKIIIVAQTANLIQSFNISNIKNKQTVSKNDMVEEMKERDSF